MNAFDIARSIKNDVQVKELVVYETTDGCKYDNEGAAVTHEAIMMACARYGNGNCSLSFEDFGAIIKELIDDYTDNYL